MNHLHVLCSLRLSHLYGVVSGVEFRCEEMAIMALILFVKFMLHYNAGMM